MMKVRTSSPLWMAAAALLVVATTGGCGGSAAPAKPPRPTPPSALHDISGPEPAIPALAALGNGNPNQPEVLQSGDAVIRPDGSVVLPLDAYEVADNEAVLARAKTALAQQCMRAKGLDLPASLMDQTGPSSPPPSVLYGVIDMDSAKTYGYRLPPQQSGAGRQADASHDDITPAIADAYFENTRQNKLGCAGEARQKLNTAKVEDADGFVNDLRQESSVAANGDSRVKAVTAKWSSCMKNAGFDYPDPQAPAHDHGLLGKGLPTPAGAALPPPSPDEIAVAVTDVTCKRQSQYLTTVALVTAAYQKEVIDKQAQRLKQGQDVWKQEVQDANKVLEGSR
jgi:hypothetical protein